MFFITTSNHYLKSTERDVLSFSDFMGRIGFDSFYLKIFYYNMVCQGIYCQYQINTKSVNGTVEIKLPQSMKFISVYQISLSLFLVNPTFMVRECGSQIQLSCFCLKYHLFPIEDGSMVSIAVGHHDPLFITSSFLFQCSSWLMHRRWLHGQHS